MFMSALKTFKNIQNGFILWKTPFKQFRGGWTDGPMDWRTDGPTKKWLIESRSTRLKTDKLLNELKRQKKIWTAKHWVTKREGPRDRHCHRIRYPDHDRGVDKENYWEDLQRKKIHTHIQRKAMKEIRIKEVRIRASFLYFLSTFLFFLVFLSPRINKMWRWKFYRDLKDLFFFFFFFHGIHSLSVLSIVIVTNVENTAP